MGAPTGSNGGASPGGDILAIHGQCNGYGESHYYFRFIPNGSGAPTGVAGKFITSVTHSATGLYKVQMASGFGQIIGFEGSVQSVSGGNGAGYQIALDNSLNSGTAGSPGGTIGVATMAAGGATYTDITADANLLVFCHLVVSNNTSVSP